MTSGGLIGAISNFDESTDLKNAVFVDQVAFKIPVKIGHPSSQFKHSKFVNFSWSEKLPDERLANYFADPKVYAKNGTWIAPCGRKLALTGGARLFRSFIGTASDHYSESEHPQDHSIEMHELEQNQLSEWEISTLLKEASLVGLAPYEFQINLAAQKAQELRDFVNWHYGVQNHNSQLPLRERALVRLEIYKEFPCREVNDEHLRSAFERAIMMAFGTEKFAKFDCIFYRDRRDKKPALLKWQTRQGLISSSLDGSGATYIKLYKKGPRMRLEIQINNPHLTTTSKEKRELGNRNRPLGDQAKKIAKEMATALLEIEKHAIALLSQAPQLSDIQILSRKIQGRIAQLLPKKKNDLALIGLSESLAKDGFATKEDAKAWGVHVKNLDRLAADQIGFLELAGPGIPGLNGVKHKPHARNKVYVLRKDWLERDAIPSPRKLSTARAACSECKAIEELPENENLAKILFEKKQSQGKWQIESILNHCAGAAQVPIQSASSLLELHIQSAVSSISLKSRLRPNVRAKAL